MSAEEKVRLGELVKAIAVPCTVRLDGYFLQLARRLIGSCRWIGPTVPKCDKILTWRRIGSVGVECDWLQVGQGYGLDLHQSEIIVKNCIVELGMHHNVTGNASPLSRSRGYAEDV